LNLIIFKLSEIYHSGFDFYALSSKTNYKNKFKIRGVPTMFIFDGSDYIQHKGSNNFETISYIYWKMIIQKNVEKLIWNILIK